MSEYIARKRARFKSASGFVNIPFGSVLRVEGDFLFWKDRPICAITSQNAYDYFSSNDDGRGRERGALVDAIITRLQRDPRREDADYQARWNKVWDDPVSQKYRRKDHEDYWIWSFAFYNAPVEDLRHIAALVQAKVKA